MSPGRISTLADTSPCLIRSLSRTEYCLLPSAVRRMVAAGLIWRQEPGKTVVTLTLPAAAEFRGHRYQYVPGAFTWNEAEANAASLGGHLVTLTSAEENHWLWTQFLSFLPAQGKRALSERGGQPGPGRCRPPCRRVRSDTQGGGRG